MLIPNTQHEALMFVREHFREEWTDGSYNFLVLNLPEASNYTCSWEECEQRATQGEWDLEDTPEIFGKYCPLHYVEHLESMNMEDYTWTRTSQTAEDVSVGWVANWFLE